METEQASMGNFSECEKHGWPCDCCNAINCPERKEEPHMDLSGECNGRDYPNCGGPLEILEQCYDSIYARCTRCGASGHGTLKCRTTRMSF